MVVFIVDQLLDVFVQVSTSLTAIAWFYLGDFELDRTYCQWRLGEQGACTVVVGHDVWKMYTISTELAFDIQWNIIVLATTSV